MGGVGVGPHSLAQHMDHPVGGFALGHQRVQCPGGRPHDVAAGLVVLRVLNGDTAGVDERLHQPLGEIVGGVVVGAGEILLADVVKDVIYASCHLVLGQGVGQFGIQNGELGEHVGTKHMANL